MSKERALERRFVIEREAHPVDAPEAYCTLPVLERVFPPLLRAAR